MDSSLIDSFRNRINEYGLVYHLFRDYKGKNKWNAICSAMDWIKVGISGIDVSNLEMTNTDRASIKMITFISCIDIMWEGIQQLHRVLFDDVKRIPFEQDREVFQKCMDDNCYWKEIRAAFAAHPTNLYGNKDDEHRFASWSGGGFGENSDFGVIIYSNDPQKEEEFFNIDIGRIMLFATSRYRYLNILINQVDKLTEKWCLKMRSIPIFMTGDSLADSKTLIEENLKRIDNDYFNYRLTEIMKAFKVNTNNDKNTCLLREYRTALMNEIKIFKRVLQEMDLGYNGDPVVDDSADTKYTYENQNIFEPDKGLVNWAVERLRVPLGRYVDFDSWETIEELQVLVSAGWWKYKQTKS